MLKNFSDGGTKNHFMNDKLDYLIIIGAGAALSTKVLKELI